MEYPSEEFVERLEREFSQKYRVRWSDARQEWHLEQRVRRAIAEGFVEVDPRNREQWRLKHDAYIRARDGYVLVMQIKPGTRTHCTYCDQQMSVPLFHHATIKCEFCASRGRAVYQIAGFFPLGDTLIDYMKHIDGTTGGQQRVSDAVNRSNDLLMRDLQANLRRPIEAATRERANRILGFPQFGYGGRPYNWTK